MRILLFILLFFTAHFAFSQQDTKEKKKGSFWKALGEAITVDGEPIGGSGLSANTRDIRGEWKEYGAGGGAGSFSPRNFAYSFYVKNPNTKLSIGRESVLRTSSLIISKSGRRYDLFSPGNEVTRGGKRIVTLLEEGRYVLYIGAPRGSIGSFRYEVEGAISDIQPIPADIWASPATAFDPEGGGGASSNLFSPRNHAYTFEPDLDTYFDINVESEGIPISLTVTDPGGRVIRGKRESTGIQYLNLQASMRGAYTIWVSPEEHNTRGNYRLNVIGYLAKSPEMIKSEFQKQTSEFRQNSSVHKYSIAADQGNLEFIYRSTSQNAAIEIQDAYGQTLRPHFSDNPTGRLQNQTVKIAAKSSVILTIANQNPGSEGTYELLLWGNFSEVKKEEIPTEGTSILSSDNPKNLLTASPNTIGITGRLTSSGQPISNLVRIIVDDLEKGERIGEVKPDASGTYTLYLPKGREYSITALTPGNQIASSHVVDLSGSSTANSRITLAPITIVSATEVGGKLTLNNIFFDTGSPILLRRSYAELKRVAGFLKDNPAVKVEIAGHTDSVGDDASNLTLSQNRANSVLYYLQDQIGDSGIRLKAKGYGRTEPVAGNNNEAGRQQNRRVEFRIIR